MTDKLARIEAWANFALKNGAPEDKFMDVLALVNIAKAARRVDRIYEGLRTDENDGEFALWSDDELIAALHALRPALAALDEEAAG